MLTTVNDETPVASTWLDRLRLSKGLSITNDEDSSGTPLTLDDFLRRNNQIEITGDLATSSDSPPSAPTPSDPELDESPSDPNQGEWYGVMSDVLSELFNFGESSSSSRSCSKKLPRKQLNPRHCSVDVPLRNEKRNSSFLLPVVREFASSSRNSFSKKSAPSNERKRSVVEDGEDGVDEEEEKGENDLVGFSRSEVTVIDTSFSVWKSEKLVFRRRNVWKVRDKKGKSKVVSLKKKMMKKTKKKKKKKKKRECDVGDGDIVRKSKKMKISRAVSDNNPRYHVEKVRDDPESSNAIRIPLSRLPSKLRKEGSFPIRTSKKISEPEARDHQSLAL